MRRLGLGVMLLVGACRETSVGVWTSEGQDDLASGEGGAPLASEAEPKSRGGAPAAAVDATRGAPLAAGGDSGEVSEPGEVGGAEGCGAESVTLDEIHSGRVRGTVPVSVGSLVASSQKFLVSEAKSGSCLWGAFAAGPGRSGAGSGLFLVSYGAPHADGESCAPGSDGLPDDLEPGDLLEVEGRLDEYVPAACTGTAPAQQLRIDAACPARRGAATAVPEAAPLDRELADRLAAGTDAQLLRDWGGALVQLDDVSAQRDEDDGDAVFPFGVIRLGETALEVHSRLYYFDLSEGGPRDPGKAPHFAFPTAFRGLTGVVFLDYCTWVLAPRSRCADLAPPSEGCPTQQ